MKSFRAPWVVEALIALLGVFILIGQVRIAERQNEIVEIESRSAKIEQENNLRTRIGTLTGIARNLEKIEEIYRSATQASSVEFLPYFDGKLDSQLLQYLIINAVNKIRNDPSYHKSQLIEFYHIGSYFMEKYDQMYDFLATYGHIEEGDDKRDQNLHSVMINFMRQAVQECRLDVAVVNAKSELIVQPLSVGATSPPYSSAVERSTYRVMRAFADIPGKLGTEILTEARTDRDGPIDAKLEKAAREAATNLIKELSSFRRSLMNDATSMRDVLAALNLHTNQQREVLWKVREGCLFEIARIGVQLEELTGSFPFPRFGVVPAPVPDSLRRQD
jgi:hypothetical protein